MRRARFKRRAPRPVDEVDRPGIVTPLGPGWRRLAREVAARDERCRFCGAVFSNGRQGHVDHLVPRRLCQSTERANAPENLALLCETHHALKTHVIEPRLYAGDALAFERFLRVLGPPGPSMETKAWAYAQAATALAMLRARQK